MAAIRVGLLDDMADGPPGASTIEPWLRQALDDVSAAGRLGDLVMRRWQDGVSVEVAQ